MVPLVKQKPGRVGNRCEPQPYPKSLIFIVAVLLANNLEHYRAKHVPSALLALSDGILTLNP